jgi:hypothetical protein
VQTKEAAMRKLLLGSCLVTVLIPFMIQGALADTVILHPAKDNTLYEDLTGSLSNGAGQFFFAGVAVDQKIKRGLIAFDIAGNVPCGSVIHNATLTMFMSRTVSPAVDVGLHVVGQDWGEGTSDAPGNEGGGAPATIGDATWIHTFVTNLLWFLPGGDYILSPSATTLVLGVGSYTWSGPGLVADVQTWLDNPQVNFGWIVRALEVTSLPSTTKRFNSRQNEDPGTWPVLEIEFSPGATSRDADSWGAIKTLYR